MLMLFSSLSIAAPSEGGAIEARPGGSINGHIGKYYDSLFAVEKHRMRPEQEQSLAVHRWLGSNFSTVEHYQLLHRELQRSFKTTPGGNADKEGAQQAQMRRPPLLMDAGCGVGGAMLWLERHEPSWRLEGYTLSTAQHEYIRTELAPSHRFTAHLRSYDEPASDSPYDAIYSIEALVHTPSLRTTIAAWARHLRLDGTVVLIDDYLNEASPLVYMNKSGGGAEGNAEGHAEGTTEEIRGALAAYRKWWLGVSFVSPEALARIAAAEGLQLVVNRDIGSEYAVVSRNYGNFAGRLPDAASYKSHQGFLGSLGRRILTVRGVMEYRLLVFRKGGGKAA